MKYEITNETIEVFGTTLRRIKALESFADVKAGDMGGFIQMESNLSLSGNSWVYGDAQVSGDARVSGNDPFFWYLPFILFGLSFGMAATQLLVFGAIKPMGLGGLVLSALLLYLVERPEKPNPTNENILDHNFEDLKQ